MDQFLCVVADAGTAWLGRLSLSETGEGNRVTMVTEAQDPASKTNVARNACTEGIRAVLRHGLRL